MNEPRANCSAVVMPDDSIYVFGGKADIQTYHDSIEKYNPETYEWTFTGINLVEKVAFPISYLREDNSIIVIGGETESKTNSKKVAFFKTDDICMIENGADIEQEPEWNNVLSFCFKGRIYLMQNGKPTQILSI